MHYITVLITTKNKKEAKKIIDRLLGKRLIACANIIMGIDSFFWWRGKKENIKECLVIAKTKASKFKKLSWTVKEIHSYEVPEIIAIPIIDGNDAYLNWIKAEAK